MSKALIYTRSANYNTTMKETMDDERNEGDGVDPAQLARCLEYAAERGFEIVGTYHDIAPGNMFTLPGLAALVKQARKEGIDTIIINDPSRLGRTLAVHRGNVEALQQAGLVIVVVNG